MAFDGITIAAHFRANISNSVVEPALDITIPASPISFNIWSEKGFIW